jgi:hypothetical protein
MYSSREPYIEVLYTLARTVDAINATATETIGDKPAPIKTTSNPPKAPIRFGKASEPALLDLAIGFL